jgi:hypothetical protein
MSPAEFENKHKCREERLEVESVSSWLRLGVVMIDEGLPECVGLGGGWWWWWGAVISVTSLTWK